MPIRTGAENGPDPLPSPCCLAGGEISIDFLNDTLRDQTRSLREVKQILDPVLAELLMEFGVELHEGGGGIGVVRVASVSG